MKTLKKASLWALGILLSGSFLSSCGTEGDESLLSQVPVTAAYVATLNVEKVLREAGCPNPVEADGRWCPMAQQLVATLAQPDLVEPMRQILALAGKEAELKHVVAYAMPNGAAFMFLKVHDGDNLAEQLQALDDVQLSHVEGYDTYSFPGFTIGIKGNTLAVAPAQEDLGEVVRMASARRFGQIIGVTNFLDFGEDAAHIAINCGGSANFSLLGDADKWACASVAVSSSALNLRLQVMDRDGRVDSIGNFFDALDPDFLRYVPGDASLVAAFGHWNGSKAISAMALSQLAKGFFFSPSGTTAFTLTPAAAGASLTNVELAQWNVQDIAQMPQQQRDSYVASFKSSAGKAAKKVDDSQWSYSVADDLQLYLSDFNDYLILSVNRQPSASCTNELAQTFRAKHAGLVLDIPQSSTLQRSMDLPCGLHFTATLDATTLNCRLTFSGDTPALERLLSLRYSKATQLLPLAQDAPEDAADDAEAFDTFDYD